MKRLVPTTRYRRDIKRLKRRSYDFRKLAAILGCLETDRILPATARPHLLQGDWDGHWECHIAPDWLLIYQTDNNEVLLARTGTHADLFE